MKKISIFILMFVCCMALTSCFGPVVVSYTVEFETNGGSTIKSQKVIKGEKVSKPTDPTKKDHEFKGWFSDEEFTKEYSFNTPVLENITLYAKWEVIITQEEMTVVVGVTLPSNILLFNNNKKPQENKKTEFMDLTQNYLVGDDNSWNALPEVSFVKYDPITGDITPITVEKWNYEITIYQSIGVGEYEVVEEESPLIESIDYQNCNIDFSEEAINKGFKVVITPEGLTENQLPDKDDYTVSFTFDVVDGFNINSPKELAYLDNGKNPETSEAWSNFKEANGLQLDYYPNNFILHKNIFLTKDDVPAEFFYSETEVNKSDSDYARVVGSMKDGLEFYERNLLESEEVHLFGNYFTIDTSNFKEVVRENGMITAEGRVISHTSLIKFSGASSGCASIENLNVVGNAPRVENAIKAGGQIFVKVQGPEFTAYNNITACLFITYFPELTFTKFLMEKCKAYDAFNSFVYNWGSNLVYINQCEMIGAGGPVIIQDHVRPTSPTDSHIAETYITNSKLESYVTGTEGWFDIVGASALVPSIKGLDALFNPFSRSFLKKSSDGTLTYMNAICVNKSGSAQGVTSEKVEGTLKIDESSAFDFGKTNPYLKGLLDMTFANGAPAFQTNVSTIDAGYAYFNGTGLYDITNTQILDPNNIIYQGDYLCLYFNGMAIVLGYYNVGEIYS